MTSPFVRRAAFAGILALSALPATATVRGESSDGGDSQSPIDIRDSDVSFVDELPDIRFLYPDALLEVINTGSPDHEATVRAIVNTTATIRVEDVTYRLTQFHFHTPSEHLLNGEEFPLELHLVHDAGSGDLLVLGVLIEVGDRHRGLRRMFRDLPANSTETNTIKHFDLDDLIPDDDGTHRYDGSLTTPPFTEGVQWIVFDEPLEMSDDQIEAFQELFPDGNTREPQPLNDRPIMSDADGRHHHDDRHSGED
jgi:carbonic anhydrase